MTLVRGSFRVRGDTIEIFPAYEEIAVRVEFFGDEIERIVEVDPLTGEMLIERIELDIFPARHSSRHPTSCAPAIVDIRDELEGRLERARRPGQDTGGARSGQRTMYDLEMMQETGYLLGRRELLDAPVAPSTRRATVNTDGLLPGGFPDVHRRIAHVVSASARNVCR